jgi:hypothetical protein
LELNEQNLEASVEVLEDEAVADGYGWDLAATPVRLKVPARTVTNWTLDPERSTPVWPDHLELSDRSETVNFVPMGCTLLRMTIFPACAIARKTP